MKLIDTIKLSQTNLTRAKLRTFLTVSAVFIGALTLSLTNGVGNGVKAYVDQQLGNMGAEDTLIVQGKQGQNNPIATEVKEYNPDRRAGTFNVTLLGRKDLDKVLATEGIVSAVPEYALQLDYITTGGKKFEVLSNQYVPGLNLQMAAGVVVEENSLGTVTIPKKYLEPLGFNSPQEALGRTVTLGFKNNKGVAVERQLIVAGVQEQSLLGNAGMNIPSALAESIHRTQTAGIANLEDNYMTVIARYDEGMGEEKLADLKKRLNDAGYNAQTIEDQIGTITTVINAILTLLNIFAIITLLAAAFGIVNTLLMSVNERTSEIGLMKALGADRRTVFSVFAIEAASIGFWGALLGVLVSRVIGTVVNSYASDHFLKNFVGFDLLAFPVLSMVGILIGITVLSLLAGTLPAIKASKLDPIKALRYE